MTKTLYMVIEHFKNGDAVSVYRRFRDRGRMTPEGLEYVSSWVGHGLARCYQVMETHDRALLDAWMAKWSDLIEFEVHPVVTSKEAAERMRPVSFVQRFSPPSSGSFRIRGDALVTVDGKVVEGAEAARLVNGPAVLTGAVSAIQLALQLCALYLVFTRPGAGWFGRQPSE